MYPQCQSCDITRSCFSGSMRCFTVTSIDQSIDQGASVRLWNAIANQPAMAVALLGVLLLLLVAQLFGSAVAAQQFGYQQSMVDGFLRPQNAARAQLGLAPLQWDARLANYAQGWANQRRAVGDCRLQHSGGPYGENIFWGAGKAWQPTEAANAWVNERQWYRYYSNSCAYYNKCGHYTQVVWRGTTRVGCGRSVCNDGNIFMTCNYYPPGNWVGQRPY